MTFEILQKKSGLLAVLAVDLLSKKSMSYSKKNRSVNPILSVGGHTMPTNYQGINLSNISVVIWKIDVLINSFWPHLTFRNQQLTIGIPWETSWTNPNDDKADKSFLPKSCKFPFFIQVSSSFSSGHIISCISITGTILNHAGFNKICDDSKWKFNKLLLPQWGTGT